MQKKKKEFSNDINKGNAMKEVVHPLNKWGTIYALCMNYLINSFCKRKEKELSDKSYLSYNHKTLLSSGNVEIRHNTIANVREIIQ